MNMDRLTRYEMARSALHIIFNAYNDETLNYWIALYANGIMDMFNPELADEHDDIADAMDVLDTLNEMKSSTGIVEDEMLQRAFDLICNKAINILRNTVLDEDEYQRWYEKIKKEVQGE